VFDVLFNTYWKPVKERGRERERRSVTAKLMMMMMMMMMMRNSYKSAVFAFTGNRVR